MSLRTFLLTGCSAGVLIAPILSALPVQEAAIPFVWPENAPRPDDVTMRTLWFRPINPDDGQDTFLALDAFHATRLEWTYLRTYEHGGRFKVESGEEPPPKTQLLEREKRLIDKVRASGRVFGGASNASTGTDVVWHGWQDATKKHTVVDISGDPLIGGHMKHWAAPQSPGCANNPHYLEGYVEYILDYIEAGAETIQRDEPSGNYSYARAGLGCYCPFCIRGFQDYLKALDATELEDLHVADPASFNYRDYMLERGESSTAESDFDWSDPASMRRITSGDPVSEEFIQFQAEAQADFFKVVRMRVNEVTGHSFPFSCNNTSFQRFDPELYHGFDFYMSELMMESANPVHIYTRSREARERGKVQVFGTPKTMGKQYDESFLTDLKRKVIATTYAVGGLSRVPWDIFQQTKDGTGRYFGDPADYADLYAMVRASGEYLSGYGDAGARGPGLDSFAVYGDEVPLRISNPDSDLYAFIRARPLDTSAPVVIHLVDWSEQPSARAIRLHKSAFFGNEAVKATLRVPAPYNREDHEKAEARAQRMRKPGEPLGSGQSAAYEPLVHSIPIDVEDHKKDWLLQLPELHPWGMLIIEKTE